MAVGLEVGQALGPEWRVEAWAPGERLTLRRLPGPDAARARGAAVMGAGSLVAAAALAGATPDGFALVTWPVAVLLVGVAVLSVPATLRSARRARLGVTLAASRAEVSGWPVPQGLLHELRASPGAWPASSVEAVEVRTAEHPPLVLSMLEVRLRDGTRVGGPEVSVPVGAAPPLDEVARALRALLQSQR